MLTNVRAILVLMETAVIKTIASLAAVIPDGKELHVTVILVLFQPQRASAERGKGWAEAHHPPAVLLLVCYF